MLSLRFHSQTVSVYLFRHSCFQCTTLSAQVAPLRDSQLGLCLPLSPSPRGAIYVQTPSIILQKRLVGWGSFYFLNSLQCFDSEFYCSVFRVVFYL